MNTTLFGSKSRIAWVWSVRWTGASLLAGQRPAGGENPHRIQGDQSFQQGLHVTRPDGTPAFLVQSVRVEDQSA
jgi:hypothetical protein